MGPRALAGTALAALALAATACSETSEPTSRLALPEPRAVHQTTPLADGRLLITGGCTLPGCEGAAEGRRSVLFDPQDGAFEAGPTMRRARLSHTATRLDDGRVLLTGGYPGEGGAATASAELYDPRGGTFTETGAMGAARADHTATLLGDGTVLIAGGRDAEGAALASTELYDPVTGRFAPGPQLLAPRAAHTATLAGGDVVVVGGARTERALARTEMLRDGRWREGPPLATPRVKHAAVALRDGRLLVVGGAVDVEGRALLDDTELLDPRRGRVTAGPRLPDGQYKLSGAVVTLPDGRVAIAGGERVVLFDPRSDTVRTVEHAAVPRRSFVTASLAGDELLVAGGYDGRIVPTAAARLVAIP
jgi:hypothetical protein